MRALCSPETAFFLKTVKALSAIGMFLHKGAESYWCYVHYKVTYNKISMINI